MSVTVPVSVWQGAQDRMAGRPPARILDDLLELAGMDVTTR